MIINGIDLELLSHQTLAHELANSGQSTSPNWDHDLPCYLLQHVAHLPLSAPQLAALAAARRAHDAVRVALTGLDDALVILAAALEQ